MIPTFLINLDQQVRRLKLVHDQLRQFNIPYERISAIDGKLSPPPLGYVNAIQFAVNFRRTPTMGEIGCARSHRYIWQMILDKNIPYALILEDDITISPSIVNILNNPSVYSTFDFINFSSIHPYRLTHEKIQYLIDNNILTRPNPWQLSKRKRWLQLDGSKHSEKIYAITTIAPNTVLCETSRAPVLGSGYIISKQAAQQFLQASNVLRYPIDHVWHYANGRLRTAFSFPSLIPQTLNESDIDGREHWVTQPSWVKFFHSLLREYRLRRHIDTFVMYVLYRYHKFKKP